MSEQITFNAEAAEAAERNAQGFLGVLCELCVQTFVFGSLLIGYEWIRNGGKE